MSAADIQLFPTIEPRHWAGMFAAHRRQAKIEGLAMLAQIRAGVRRAASDRETPTFRPFEIISVCRGGGYLYCRTNPSHPKQNSKGLYPLHRVVLENKLQRFLNTGECAHHIDGDKNNNAPENLEVMGVVEHGRHHHGGRKIRISVNCSQCGTPFRLGGNVFRKRKRTNTRGLFCSRECAWNAQVIKRHNPFTAAGSGAGAGRADATAEAGGGVNLSGGRVGRAEIEAGPGAGAQAPAPWADGRSAA